MTRRQRRVHAVLWLVLGPALMAFLAFAVAKRVRFPTQERPAGVAAVGGEGP